MLKKVLVISGLILILAFVWFSFQSLRNSLYTSDSIFDFLSGNSKNFLSISDNIVTGLSFEKASRPAQVSLEELGEFSPVAGLVEIEKSPSTIQTDNLQDEYIILRALKTNAQPINISNWSLQSMVSDEWIGIPQGTPLYTIGEVNEVEDIYLRPGESAVISTSQSPVGVSFRINRCSGFLNDTQEFEPSIKTACISPEAVILPTAKNIKDFGESCASFVEGFKSCTYVTSDLQGFHQLTQACKDYIKPRLTYNYCVDVYAGSADFFDKAQWRIFLNQDYTLWRDTYEIIRLLDEKHRTVDVVTY